MSYCVETASGAVWRRHADQIRATEVQPNPPDDLIVSDTPSTSVLPGEPIVTFEAAGDPSAKTPAKTPEAAQGETASIPVPQRRYPLRERKRPKKLDL